ncbi:MAG: hypothetical protein IJD39_09025 [Clostridia bacterium]|nr:hypothetical protein [Clostridia bacterium]
MLDQMLCFLIAALIVCTSTPICIEEESIKNDKPQEHIIIVNEKRIDAKAYAWDCIHGHYVMLPFVEIMIALGAEVTQDDPASTVYIKYKDTSYTLNLDSGFLFQEEKPLFLESHRETSKEKKDYSANWLRSSPGSKHTVFHCIYNNSFYVNKEAVIIFFSRLKLTLIIDNQENKGIITINERNTV